MKSQSHNQLLTLNQIIRSKSEPKLVSFLEFLRSDLSLMEIIDPPLKHYYAQLTNGVGIEKWMSNFPKMLNNRDLIKELLIELEDLKPINRQVRKPGFFRQECKKLVNGLEERLAHLGA